MVAARAAELRWRLVLSRAAERDEPRLTLAGAEEDGRGPVIERVAGIGGKLKIRDEQGLPACAVLAGNPTQRATLTRRLPSSDTTPSEFPSGYSRLADKVRPSESGV